MLKRFFARLSNKNTRKQTTMTTRLLTTLTFCTLAAGLTQAAAIRYMNSGDYLVAANWQGGVIPGAIDQARMNWGNNTVTLAGLAPTILNLQTGVDESGTLVINSGGSLTSTGWSMIGAAGGGGGLATTGTLTINNGGVMNVNSHFWSGVATSTGVTNINSGGILNVGGILGLGSVDAVNPSGGVASVFINDGGIFNLGNIHGAGTSIQPGSVLDISGSGQLIISGDKVGSIGNYVTAGQITGNGVVGDVVATFDSGFTTVTAIPEPSTTSLLGLLGICTILRRRRKS